MDKSDRKHKKLNLRELIDMLSLLTQLLALSIFSLILKTIPGLLVVLILLKNWHMSPLQIGAVYLLVNGLWIAIYNNYRKKD